MFDEWHLKSHLKVEVKPSIDQTRLWLCPGPCTAPSRIGVGCSLYCVFKCGSDMHTNADVCVLDRMSEIILCRRTNGTWRAIASARSLRRSSCCIPVPRSIVDSSSCRTAYYQFPKKKSSWHYHDWNCSNILQDQSNSCPCRMH